ncbi:nicotinate-nucleotide adenylyltransferase [Paenibacillus albiflavus]|uniref:Probable nicotinate-nucleotide adenylyltransferase n=1 Tax=Paenibacillus albiflavus TaxID=2545760 RepID=A0A4R4EG08_9BACL|nr:nicotinate-nucleotide adenylyltransferase [Paenibacillus albiflavus]TCZ77048.1 nicotinate-nucleotide adenylyltransferase [Paenibacillus albiflavus]
MRIGIMGGTFDPIHLGHLIAAESVRTSCELDEVWFMPTFVPPHKSNAPKATPEERLEMVRLAVEDNPFFHPFDYELRKGGVSYSIETMTELRVKYPDHEFYYIIGGDMVQFLPKWVRIEEMVQFVQFIGLNRPGYTVDLSELPPLIAKAVTMTEMPSFHISSTYIRERCLEGLSIRYCVPKAVEAYIRERKLYES